MPAERPDPVPDQACLAVHGEYRLTDAPVTRVSWRDVELDEESARDAAEPATVAEAAASSDQDAVPDGRGGDSPFGRLPDTPDRDEWTETLGAPAEAPEPQDLREQPEGAGRLERLRRVGYEHAEDVHDAVGGGFRTVHDWLSAKPPTGQPETRQVRPTFERPQPYGTDAGDAAISVIVAGVLVGEGLRRAWEQARKRIQEGRNNAGDR